MGDYSSSELSSLPEELLAGAGFFFATPLAAFTGVGSSSELSSSDDYTARFATGFAFTSSSDELSSSLDEAGA